MRRIQSCEGKDAINTVLIAHKHSAASWVLLLTHRPLSVPILRLRKSHTDQLDQLTGTSTLHQTKTLVFLTTIYLALVFRTYKMLWILCCQLQICDLCDEITTKIYLTKYYLLIGLFISISILELLSVLKNLSCGYMDISCQ